MADGVVTQRHEFQALLKRLRGAGILLVALSKNDPAKVRWEEMTLKPADFVLQKIGWGHKAESVAEVAGELNLSRRGLT